MTELRRIPSVTSILEDCVKQPWAADYSRQQIVNAIREETDRFREQIQSGKTTEVIGEWPHKIHDHLSSKLQPSLRKLINASGIIVHTNLGRAPLASAVISRIQDLCGYSNLEFDLESGHRGSRDKHLENFLLQLLPVEAALIANNNAAALLLILNSIADGKEVLVSRGELVEIGGSFRLPEIMKKSGAILQEVGTTNKTRAQDYEAVITERTAMILVVHPSNYQIVGFTERAELSALVQVGRKAGIPVVEDHGSGILFSLEEFGIQQEPTVEQRLKEGVDLICFSGDKILGGPQAGIICGKKHLVDQLKQNPLFRALRVDKLTYAALEATLLLHLSEKKSDIPVYRMLSETVDQLHSRGDAWISGLQQQFPQVRFDLQNTECFIGGGVAPMKGIPSVAVTVIHPSLSANELAHRLRSHHPPIVARVEEDRLFLELRTLTIGEQQLVQDALAKILTTSS